MAKNFRPTSILCAGWMGGILCALAALVFSATLAFGQADQGAITGTVVDSTGARIPNAQVTLTNVDTGLVLHARADASGRYIFSPIKIGNYSVSAAAAGFRKTTQLHLHVDVAQRLAVRLTLQAGSASQTVVVTGAPPLLQTQQGSTGQVMSTRTINRTPLNGRNWVFIAQLAAGVAPPSGSRGANGGDFNANGQRAEQNNFILDGVDNNNNVVDFLNGASYMVRPPPDALAEFKIQTGSYSAQFGHSAGAVVNASIKSGTNHVHGDLWEYVRNDAFDIRQEFQGSNPVPKYRQNQFGATLGFPILRNKLFFFGDTEANRIVFAESHTDMTVPTALMRKGDFSELLNPADVAGGTPITLYEPNATANGTQVMPGNKLTSDQIDPLAQKLMNLYPLPNAGTPGQTYNNYNIQSNVNDNTYQWDARMDYNMSAKDQMFSRFSYSHHQAFHAPPLGSIMDGGNFGDTGNIFALGENFMFSETHIFSPTLTNEFRFGYNYGHFGYHQVNANTDISSQLGLGGIPYAPLNGGLPYVNVSGYSHFGAPQFYVSDEHDNEFQILDNVMKTVRGHTLHMGVNFQKIRFATEQPTNPRGNYNYTGVYTSKVGTSNTGFGGADFLLDQMNSSGISNLFTTDDARWNRAAYFQDDWRVSSTLTLNLGVRYEYAQPYFERHGNQALFYPTSTTPNAGTGVYLIPAKHKGIALSPIFTSLLQRDNISIQYSNNPSLVEGQKTNFAPRFGFAWHPLEKLVLHGGYGIFYGGLESPGYYPNLGENYPFEFDSSFPAATSCVQGGSCPTNGFKLKTGFSSAIAAGLQNAINVPNLRGSDPKERTPYSEQYNLTVQYGLSRNMTASVGYVGSVSRHLQVFPNPNGMQVLAPAGYGPQYNPFTAFPGVSDTYTSYDGISSYNSLQTTLQRRFAQNMSFLATYTWSHSLDDAPTPLGSTGDPGYRNTALVPIRYDYSNSAWDIRQRLTLSGSYFLPFGQGQRFVNSSRALNYVVGGWSTSMVVRMQTGEAFTVYPSDITSPSGAGTRAILIGDPFKGGGSPDPAVLKADPSFTCPARVRTLQHWYNPCAFRNPKASDLTYKADGTPNTVGFPAALAYLGSPRNQIHGPGYGRVDASLFKTVKTWHEQNLQLRADVFNLLNTPAYGEPSHTGIAADGGQITGLRYFQDNTPDSRFFQFAVKYIF